MAEQETATTGVPLLNRLGIIAVVCICGWLVMQTEILGARILTPYFGSAIYVTMGSVIGVFLLSLSVGYMLGGWLSRRRASMLLLGLALVAAGVWLVLLPFMVEPLCDRLLDAGFSDEWGSLVAALGLFGAPLVMLGMVSPTAVGWLTTSAERSGPNAGLVMSTSTVASFSGTIVTAFYLLRLSVGRTLRVSGLVLIVLGAVLALRWAWAAPGRAAEEEGE